MEKADVLLKAQEEASNFTADLHSIQSWLEKSTSDPPSLTTKICHPLATPPHTVLHEETVSQVLGEKLPAGKIKEEPLSPGSEQPTPTSVNFAETQPKEIPLSLGKQAKASPSPGRPQPIGAIAPTAAPQKSKAKVRGLSILCSALEIPPEVKLLAGSRKPKATSTPQSFVVRYNLCSCHLGGLPTRSIEMKELKDSSNLPTKGQESPL